MSHKRYNLMNSICEVCDVNQAEVYCLDCVKFHIYCQKCFTNFHRSDSKKSHKTQVFSAPKLGRDNLEEILFCLTHNKKLKEHACLTCDMAICPDCLITGDHKEHKADSLQKGYEKVVNEFEARAVEHDGLLKLSENKSNMVLNYLNAIVKEIVSIKKEVQCYSHNVINLIEKKTAETVDIIDKEMASLREDIELLQKGKEGLKRNIENCQDNINKINMVSLEVYHKFTKNNGEIQNTRVAFYKWLPIASEASKKYISPPMEHAYKFIDNIKEYTTDFEKNLSLAEYKIFFTESSILKQARYKSLLVNWIIEAIGKPNFSSKLLWKGTVHGFGASIFHKNCDDKGRTVTVVLSERDYIFGGYTSKPWSSSTGYVDDPEAFIFSLTHKTKHSKQRYITGN